MWLVTALENTARLSLPACLASRMPFALFAPADSLWSRPFRADKAQWRQCLGAERGTLAALCAAITADGTAVELANVNCPGQIVVSGTAAGVQAVVERGKEEAGAKRVIPLEVSGPFHSSLMKPAADNLQATLASIAMKDATVPVVANVTANVATAADDIRSLLVEQVYSPVLWEDSVRYLIEQGVDTFVEIGSGTVLAGLIKKIDKNVSVISINSISALEALQVTEH